MGGLFITYTLAVGPDTWTSRHGFLRAHPMLATFAARLPTSLSPLFPILFFPLRASLLITDRRVMGLLARS